jgi:hypothetical protein
MLGIIILVVFSMDSNVSVIEIAQGITQSIHLSLEIAFVWFVWKKIMMVKARKKMKEVHYEFPPWDHVEYKD